MKKFIFTVMTLGVLLGIGQASTVSAAETNNPDEPIITITSIKDPGTGGR